jgi:hypothetical protein
MAIVPGLPARAADLTLLTFDDLAVPAGGRVTLNTQYAARGVTFNTVSALDYAPPSFPAGFAHSGRVGIEQCFAIEFCTAPITASFTSGQLRVKAWVGYSFALPAPLTVRMTAFNAAHVAVGSADVTLPPNSAVTPIRSALEVTTANPTIRSIEIGVPGGGYTNALAVDDLEFSSAGPPPPCNATATPAVRLTQPAGDITVQNDAFLLEGTVENGGAPIESASIVNRAQGGNREAPLYPALVDADGGTFGPVRYSGLLFPGENKLVVSARNCLGTGTSQVVDVSWNGIPAGASFRQIGLEVTQGVQLVVSQGVQTSTTFVPLIAATPTSFKRTIVRVYLAAGGVSRVTGVSGRLTASRPDGTLPGGPATIPSLNTITVEGSAALASVRSSLTSSLNFELPREWLAAGQLHLQLDHLTIEGARSTLPCIDCDNPGPQPLPGQPAPGPALVRFETAPPVRVWIVGVPYLNGTTQVTPRQLDFDMLTSWLRRAYPTADVQVTQTSMAPLASPPASCDAVNAVLGQWAAMLPAQDPRTRFYGLIPDDGRFVGGCSDIDGQYGSGPAGDVFPETSPWDLDGSYADAYGGHEIGHLYGREHPGFCAGQDRADAAYPYLNGAIGGYLGSSVVDVQGLDVGDGSLGLPMTLYDWTVAHDVMSYCRFQWMSDYTYRGILRNLCRDDAANCPNPARLGVAALRVVPATQAVVPGFALSITGTIALATGKVTLDPIWSRKGLSATPASPGSVYAIELRDARGRVLVRHPFEPTRQSSHGTGGARARIHEVVAFPAGTTRIAIVRGGTTLASVRVTANAPTVRVLSPNTGAGLADRVTVRWLGSDKDGDRLWYTVLYRPNAQQTIPIATGIRGTSLSVNLAGLPGGRSASFEVVASDGVRTGSDRSDRAFSVPLKAPRVSIVTPAKGATLGEGEALALVGTAIDAQDGQVAASIVWDSSLQGHLGTGPAITATLRPGSHTITLTATNRAGQSAAARVQVTVRPIPPTVVAQIGPSS